VLKVEVGLWGVSFTHFMVSCYLSVFQKWRILFLLKIFWPQTRGPPGARGPNSLNRLNPRFLRHCVDVCKLNRLQTAQPHLMKKNTKKNSGVNEGKAYLLPQLGCSLTLVLHSAYWRSETDQNIAISISAYIDNHFSTPCQNLMRFRSLNQEFKT